MPFTPDVISVLLGVAGVALGFGLARFVYGKYIADCDRLNKEVQQLLQEKTKAETENAAFAETVRQHKADIAEMEKKFALQFENLANRIFQEKSATFKKESQEGLGQLLNPLKEKLQEFQKKVDDSFGQQAKEQFSLRKEIENIVSVNEKMSLQTENLTKALKGDVKAQGNWGEVMLEKILEESGLRRDDDYTLQGAELGLKDAEGRAQKPDVIVNLPENKHIIVDAKVSLTHYERYCSAEDEAARASALKDFIASIRAHVAGLEQRRYQDTGKLGTPDLVLMFMPVEGAYSLAVQEDAGLHSNAWDRKVVIVSPVTLFATLRTIASLWRIERQNRNTLEIARQGGMLYDKVAGFVKDMDDLGKKLSAAHDVYDKAYKNLTTGPGNIVKRTQDLQALGVKTSKTLPQGLLEDDAEGDGDTVTPLKTAENG
ncbi:MAG: DNA recombination protein RmuC [Alphaproteobacteria bacterium]|nr:MAG: DNA recombination protein RmuC [Alphaproteobacteria bacterium]